ncbi:MAG: hypothetical protein J5803_03025 [Desulfovibrio sp.]|nr:hypothetical protein [Desulfovibrio sp.]
METNNTHARIASAFFWNLDSFSLPYAHFIFALERLAEYGYDICPESLGETLATYVNRYLKETGEDFVHCDLCRATLFGVARDIVLEVEEKIGIELDITIEGSFEDACLRISEASYTALLSEVSLRTEEDPQFSLFECLNPPTRLVLEACDENDRLLEKAVLRPRMRN